MDSSARVDLARIDASTTALGTLVDAWALVRDTAVDVQSFTVADLGYSPTQTGQSRHINIKKVLEVREKLTEIEEGLRQFLRDDGNNPSARVASLTLGEVKYALHNVKTLIDDFESSRQADQINELPRIPEHEDYVEGADGAEDVFEMDGVSCATTPEEKCFSDPLAKYNIVRKLRNTLQGELFYGTSITTGADVAIKVCRKDLILSNTSCSGNPVMEDPFSEIKVMKTLSEDPHENVLRLIDHFEKDDKLYVVLEFASRGEFYDIISQAGRLDDEVARVYFKQLAHGLHHMHSRGICHLDLSLENLLMDSNGNLKICDFGLARFIETKPFKFSSRPGKIQYMSPEVFSCSEFNGDRSDMFSLGVILFIILCGFPPFDRPAVSDMRFSYILNGHMKELLKRWKLSSVLSPLAVDLMGKLLCPAEQRLTISEVLEHPWMKL